MNDFIEAANSVGASVTSLSDAQALADVKVRAAPGAALPWRWSRLRVAIFAVAPPALLAAATVGALVVHNSVSPHLQNRSANGGVIATTPTPTVLAAAPATASAPAPKPSPAAQAAPAVAAAVPLAATQPPQPANPNLFSNPSFETNTSGWQPYNSKITRVAYPAVSGRAPSGSYVAQVTCTSGADYDIGSSEGINDPLDIFGQASKTYIASVWVRAASSASQGKQLQLHIRERHGGDGDANNLVDNASPAVTLNSTFQKVTISLTDKYDGDYLDIFAMQNGSCTNADAFYADEFVLTTN